VQDLHGDAPAFVVHGVGDHAVLVGLPAVGHLARERLDPALDVRGEAAGDDEPYAAAGAGAEVGGELRERADLLLQAHVHGAHEHAVAQRERADVERGEQGREGGHNNLSGRLLSSDGRGGASRLRSDGGVGTRGAGGRMVARFIGMLFVAGCTCSEQAEVVPAADAAPLQVERVGQAAPLPALPAPKADGCKRTFVVGELQGLGNRALFDQSGLGNASPVVLLRDGQPLRAHVQPDDQACDDTFIHGSLSVLAQVTADGAWSLGWSPELPLLTRERNKDVPVWWVYPGTTLRVRGEEAGPIGVFAEATAGGSWTLQAAGAQAELAAGAAGTVRGAIVAGSAPWTLEITAPPDGAALAVRGVVVGHGDAATVVIGERPPAGVRLVGGPSQAKATAKAPPPAIPGGGGVKPDTKPGPQPRGRLELGALGELAPGVIVDRAGAPGCSPLLVLEDNKPVGPAHAPVKDVLANGHGAWAIQPGTALVTASDGSDPAKNGRSYTLALDADRACRGGVWVYPGDEVTVSVEGLKAGAGGATQLALTARPFAGAVAQQQLWVKLEVDGG
jgi:hypothetical protein